MQLAGTSKALPENLTGKCERHQRTQPTIDRPNGNYGRKSIVTQPTLRPLKAPLHAPALIVGVLAIHSQWNCGSQAAVLQSVEHLDVTASLTPFKVGHVFPESIHTGQGHQPL